MQAVSTQVWLFCHCPYVIADKQELGLASAAVHMSAQARTSAVSAMVRRRVEASGPGPVVTRLLVDATR